MAFKYSYKHIVENAGYLNAFASPETEESEEGANEGLTCNCPDNCDQIVYNKVGEILKKIIFICNQVTLHL